MNYFRKESVVILLISFISLLGHASFAQGQFTVKGELIDSATNQGAPYATIAILDQDKIPLVSNISDEKGRFSLTLKSEGDYFFAVSSVGYISIEHPLKVDQKTTDLGKVVFIPGVELESVVVATTKPLIRSDIDKIAYSVEDDPETPTSTALDILRKVPLVSVDGDDNVYLQGQSNYKVLMNGKSSSMLSSNFKETMRSMPASSIKDIEVITNPSSKYEAEGVGGIINIITNRRSDIGYNGSVGINGSTRGDYGGYGNIAAKLGKFSLSANAYIGHWEQADATTSSDVLYKLRDSLVNTRGGLDADGRYMNLQVEASYEIDTFNLITLSMWSYNQRYDMDQFSLTESWNRDPGIAQSYRMTRASRNKNSGLSGNLDYQRTFMKPDRTLTFSYKLDNFPNKQTSETHYEGIVDFPTYQMLSINDAFSREHTFQVDYTEPINTKHTIEVGAKYIFRKNESDPESYSRLLSNEQWEVDADRRNDLDYDQHILGAYTGYTFKANNKLSFKAGARMESTWNDGLFTNAVEETKLDNNFFDVVPYATISYAPNPAKRTSVSYTQRLSRPGIWYLNPYLNDTDPNSWSQGNPDLDTEIAHQINLSYGIFSPVHTLNLTASSVIVNNSIERVARPIEVDGREISYTTYENSGRRERYGLNAYYSFRKGAGFSVNINAGANYIHVSGMDAYGVNKIKNNGWQYRLSGNMRIGLWKDAAFNTFGGYFSKNIMLQGERTGMYYYGMGVNQRFLKKKLNFSVNAQNPFSKDQKYSSETSTPELFSYSEQLNKRRRVNFSLSYNFGKMNVQVKKAKRGIKNDDVKSGENGGSGGGGGAQ